MGRCVTLFVFLLYLRLVLSSDQASTMTQVYEIFQNSNGSSFVWKDVGKDSSPCSWRGVSCSYDNSSIVGLSFPFFAISTSEFLPLLCKIDTLVSLDVSNNQLRSIPDGFLRYQGVENLKLLNFSGNKMVGSLPAFNGFKTVELLDCSDNLFNGKIYLQLVEMDSFGELNLLEELPLSFNNFSGEIPAQLTEDRNLKLIDLRNNKLSGSIPEKLRGLTNVTTLQRLAANQNKFNGTIPTWDNFASDI